MHGNLFFSNYSPLVPTQSLPISKFTGQLRVNSILYSGKICSSILESSGAIFFKGMQNWSAPNVNRQFLQSACPRCCTGRLLLCLSLQSQSADTAVWIREWTLSLLLSPLGHQGTWLFSQSPSLLCSSFSASSSS